jgi:hypothetical protein
MGSASAKNSAGNNLTTGNACDILVLLCKGSKQKLDW